MTIILFFGALASLAGLGKGAHVLWRAYADKRHIQARLKQYASR